MWLTGWPSNRRIQYLRLIMWISGWKVQNLKYLLWDDANTEEGKTILWEWKKLMLYQETLYHCHTPIGEFEEVLWFVVPTAHQDAGHQGQEQTLYLLHDQFWWPGMATQMQKAISNCKWCIQHEDSCAKAPKWSIIFTAPLELQHIEFTSIETTVELDQPPNMVNLLVFCDHFTKHVKAYMIPDQTVETAAKFLRQGYISIFRALVKLLSDCGAKFESNIIREQCKLMSKQKVRTSPYHAQTNGQVEWAHQTLMCKIGTLSKDWKANWLNHLPELVHAYNPKGSAIAGYSSHYLMFRCQPSLPIDFYFPMIRGMKKHQCVDHYIAKLCEWLWEAFKEAQVQSTSEAGRQNWYYDKNGNAISLELGDLVLAKANAYKGRRKMKDHWEEELYKLECQAADGFPSYLMRNQWTGCSWVLHQNWLFLIAPTERTHLCMAMCAKCSRWTTTTLEEQTLEESETEEVPQSVNCPSMAQHVTGKTPLGWVNRKLCVFIQMFSRASLLDKGWKVQHRGIRGVWMSMLAFQRQRYWSLQWGLKDMTNHDFFNPTSLHSRDCKLTTWGCETGVLACALFLGWLFCPEYIYCETPGIPHTKDPMPLLQYQTGRKNLLYKLTWNLSKNPWEGTGFRHPLHCESVKLFRLPSVSDTWHKRQNSV